MTNLKTLPIEIQEKVKSVLKAYDEVHVVFEYGEYHVSAGIALKATYGDDHKFIGTYKATEIFTPEERIINYVEAFHDYPIQYKGKKDYGWLNSLTWDDRVKFDENGNLVNA